MELPYNSKNAVKTQAGVYKEAVSAGTDIILADETFESAFMYNAIENAAIFKLRDLDLATVAREKGKEKNMNLNRRYPSTEAPVQSNYYSKYNKI